MKNKKAKYNKFMIKKKKNCNNFNYGYITGWSWVQGASGSEYRQ